MLRAWVFIGKVNINVRVIKKHTGITLFSPSVTDTFGAGSLLRLVWP